MPDVAPRRPPIVRSLGISLALLGLAIVLLAAVEVGVSVAASAGPLWIMLQLPLAALVFLVTGLTAWWRRPGNRTGAIMVCGAVVLLVNDLSTLSVPWLVAVAVVSATVMLALLVHLLLAFPSGRLRGAAARWTVLAGYGVCLVLQIPLYLFDPDASPGGMLAVARLPGVQLVGTWVQRGCGLAVMVSAALILATRFRRAGRRQRRVIGPLYVYGIAAVLAVPLIGTALPPLIGLSDDLITLLQVAEIALVPVTVGLAMLLGGFARTGEVQELGTWLAAAGERPALRDALARALGDPSVQLSFWASYTGGYVDQEGRPALLVGSDSSRAVAEIDADGRPVAAIQYDAGLIEDPHLVASAGQVVVLALDRERLTAELLASRRDLHQSRARIVQAGDAARLRIAQDLHDGLQAELVLLGVQAQDLADIPGATKDVAAAATGLRKRIDGAAASLRTVVYTVMPPPLTDGGLIPAVEDLVDRLRVPARLEVDVDSAATLPEPVQRTAYFVVAEGLSNAIKHAHAEQIGVRLADCGGVLTVEVSDDGDGGARIGGGRGLNGLIDRVQALEGRLTVHSPQGQGTRLVAEVPRGS